MTDTFKSKLLSRVPALHTILAPTQVSDNQPGPAPPDPEMTGLSTVLTSDPAPVTDKSTTTTTRAQEHQQGTSPASVYVLSSTTDYVLSSTTDYVLSGTTDYTQAQAGTLSAVPAPPSPSISVSSTPVPQKHTTAIAGGIAGGILGACVLAFLLYFVVRHRRKKSGATLVFDQSLLYRYDQVFKAPRA